MENRQAFNIRLIIVVRCMEYLSQAAQDLLSRILVRDPEKRLGSGELDAEEIKTHEFFKDMNWVELANAKIPPPWRPEVAGSLDVSHFDTDFTTLPLGERDSRSIYLSIYLYISY